MRGEDVYQIILFLIVSFVTFVCVRNLIRENKRKKESEEREEAPAYDPTIELRGDLVTRNKPVARTLTSDREYASEHDLWICPLCETFVSKSRSRCFICDGAKQG